MTDRDPLEWLIGIVGMRIVRMVNDLDSLDPGRLASLLIDR